MARIHLHNAPFGFIRGGSELDVTKIVNPFLQTLFGRYYDGMYFSRLLLSRPIPTSNEQFRIGLCF